MSKENTEPEPDGESKRKFDLEDRLIAFAVRALNVAEALPTTRAGSHIATQLVRCGTSPASNYGEVQGAESANDFIHKMKVCLKELRESRVWLLIVQRKPLVKAPDILDPLLGECNELIAIFRASIATAEKNRARRAPPPAE